MSRFLMRRGRILPGPLKALPLEAGRSPVPVTSLAVTAAALAAGLFLLPHPSPRTPSGPAPAPMATVSDAPVPETVADVSADDASSVVAPQRPAAGETASPLVDLAALSLVSAPEPVRPAIAPAAARPTVSKAAAVPPVKRAAADPSLFVPAVLPVLTSDGVGLDMAANAPRRPASRKAASSARAVAAVGEP